MGVSRAEPLRQTVVLAFSISGFGGGDAGSAGADEYPDTLSPVARRGGFHGGEESVLLQTQHGQSIVTAVKIEQVLLEGECFQAPHTPDPGL